MTTPQPRYRFGSSPDKGSQGRCRAVKIPQHKGGFGLRIFRNFSYISEQVQTFP